MSLAVAIDQIRRPTWWFDSDRTAAATKRRHNKEHLGKEGRKAISEALQLEAGLTIADLADRTGRTKASISYLLTSMVDAGLVFRKTRTIGLVFELTPTGMNFADSTQAQGR